MVPVTSLPRVSSLILASVPISPPVFFFSFFFCSATKIVTILPLHTPLKGKLRCVTHLSGLGSFRSMNSVRVRVCPKQQHKRICKGAILSQRSSKTDCILLKLELHFSSSSSKNLLKDAPKSGSFKLNANSYRSCHQGLCYPASLRQDGMCTLVIQDVHTGQG